MLRSALVLASLAVLGPSCAAAPPPRAEEPVLSFSDRPAPPRKYGEKRRWLRVKRTPDLAPKKAEPAAPSAPQRRLGDFHVYQYAGTFSKHAVTLTEQVVAEEDGLLVVDFVLEEAEAMTAMRVRMQKDGQPVSVTRIGAEGEMPGTLADYEALVDKTRVVPDTNDEELASEKTSCLVGEENVECEVTTYKVSLGERLATLTITRSAGLPGRDIGGDLVGEDGQVLYSARLVERGNEPPVVEALSRMARLSPLAP